MQPDLFSFTFHEGCCRSNTNLNKKLFLTASVLLHLFQTPLRIYDKSLFQLLKSQLRNELESEYKILVSEKRIRQLQERAYSFDHIRSLKSVQRYSLQLDDSQSIIIAKEESDPNSKVNKWPVSNIRKIITDKLCTHYNPKKENTFYFSLTMDPRDDASYDNTTQFKTYNFTCNHKKNYYVWIDGLNILLTKSPTSQDYKDDVLNLVRMEMKIRFLLLSKENIHHEAPALPTLPNNYDFID